MNWKAALRTVLLLTLAVGLLGCQSEDAGEPNPQSSAAAAVPIAPDSTGESGALSLDVARDRARRIAGVAYDIHLDLSQPGDRFNGRVTARFTLSDPDDAVHLDFGGGSVDSVEANGNVIDSQFDGHWLKIPASALQAGDNVLDVVFSQAYRGDGTGLHRFVDPADGRSYLYTYLWPYYANQVFPLFDQPNLKAVFRLGVKAPAEWTVVSTAPGTVVERNDQVASWQFEPTRRIASYVFSLHAGPYRIWESSAGDIPLRLMARQSLAEHVAVDEWFDITRRGFTHYQRYYDVPYPFGKYDQLIVPDFQIGAMENVAAVTFGEQYVQRQESSFAERERRASVILHEMAHMWFGDLVTHHWWNGLWLNESFATQMATIAMAEATAFDDYWHGFFIAGKQAAYWKDSRVTTHPIEMPIRSTDEFFAVFDAITYQKGASVLKQLAYRVGAANYRAGVSAYLKRHAYGNTELDDFISSIAAAAGEDLSGWSSQWLDQAGFNVVSTEVTCQAEQPVSVTIRQRASRDGPPARSHASQIALYSLDDSDQLVRTTVLDARFDGETSSLAVPASVPCPDLVWPNYRDWGYFEVALSETELDRVRDHLLDLSDDAFTQSMLLDAYFDAAERGNAGLADAIALAESLLARTERLRLITQATDRLAATVTLLERLSPESDRMLATVRPRLETLARERLDDQPGSDRQRLWFEFFLAVTGSDAGLGFLRELLDGHAEVPGLALSEDLRWRLLERLARFGTDDAVARLAEQRLRDGSDFGEKMAIAVEASLPDLEIKRRWLAAASQPGHPLGLARQRMAMNALLPANQSELNAQLLPEVLDALSGLAPGVDPYFAARYAQGLLVPLCSAQGSEAYRAAMQAEASLASTALLFLKEAQQANGECRELRAALLP